MDICAWQRKKWPFYCSYRGKTAFFSFYQHPAAVPYCMIKEKSTCDLFLFSEKDTGTPFIASKTLGCTWWHFYFSSPLSFWGRKYLQLWPYRNRNHARCCGMKEALWCEIVLVRSWAVRSSTFFLYPPHKWIVHIICQQETFRIFYFYFFTLSAEPRRLFHPFDITDYCEAAPIFQPFWSH